MSAEIFVETKRLILGEIIPEDANKLLNLDADPLVHRFLRNKPLKSREEAVERIELIRAQYEENGIGRWAVIEKETAEFTEWSGLKLEPIETNGFKNYIDLGFRFIPKYWGRGYASESELASVVYGFEKLGYESIYGAADADNIGSNKALQKSGFKFINDFEYDRAPHKWYALTRDQYLVG